MVVLVACCAACSPGEAAPTTATPGPTSTVRADSSTSTAVEPDGVVAAGGAASTQTAEPTTSPDITPTLPADDDELRLDLSDAAIASWLAFNELLLDPTNDERLKAVASTRAGRALDHAIEVVSQYRVEGQVEKTNERFPAQIDVETSSITWDRASGRGTVEYCRLGSNVWVEIGSGQGGTDLILDDSINSYLVRDEFIFVAGSWLKVDGTTLAKFEGELSC
ncbi:MAG TPA: hypothetical protein VIS05_06615 [Ilumatobacter sp.]